MNKPKLNSPFPEEFAIEWIDLNLMLKGGSDSAMLLRIYGDSMEDVPIFDGDWIMVDRAKEPKQGDLLVKKTDGDYCISIYEADGRRGLRLVGDAMPEIEQSEIFGVVTFIIKPLGGAK